MRLISRTSSLAALLSLLAPQPDVSFAETPAVVQSLSESSDSQDSPAEQAEQPVDELKYPGKKLRDAMLRYAKHFEKAVENDPHQAANYAGLADSYISLWCFGFSSRDEAMPTAKAAALRAVELDDQLAAAQTALGVVRLSEWDWAAAERALRRAIELEPERAASHHWYALYLAAMGRHDQALAESELAVKLDASPGMQIGLGAILYFGRDWQRMITQMKQTVDEMPESGPAYDWLGMAYVQEKRFDESINAYLAAVKHSDRLAEIVAGLGHAYGLAGKEAQAKEILDELNALDEKWYIPPVQIAYVYTGLGQNQQALDLLERAYRERSWELVFLQVEPWFDELRTEPRFVDLIKRIDFPLPHRVEANP